MKDTVTPSQGSPAIRHEPRARRNDRDHGSRKSSGPAAIVPHQQAGHMTEADQIVRNVKKELAIRGRPHMTVSETLQLRCLKIESRGGDAITMGRRSQIGFDPVL